MKKLILLIVLIICAGLYAAGDGRTDFIVYDGTVAYTAPYYRLVRVSDLQVWDQDALKLSYSATYNESDITMTKNTNVVGYPIDLPSTLPGGDYDFLVYDNAAPVNTDAVQIGKRLRVSDGGKLTSLPIDL